MIKFFCITFILLCCIIAFCEKSRDECEIDRKVNCDLAKAYLSFAIDSSYVYQTDSTLTVSTRFSIPRFFFKEVNHIILLESDTQSREKSLLLYATSDLIHASIMSCALKQKNETVIGRDCLDIRLSGMNSEINAHYSNIDFLRSPILRKEYMTSLLLYFNAFSIYEETVDSINRGKLLDNYMATFLTAHHYAPKELQITLEKVLKQRKAPFIELLLACLNKRDLSIFKKDNDTEMMRRCEMIERQLLNGGGGGA